VSKEFHQTAWDESLQADWHALLRLAMAEDLGAAGDWTTRALVPAEASGQAAVVGRQAGVVAGLPAAEMALREIDPRVHWLAKAHDGDPVAPGQEIAHVQGLASSLLSAERLVLNVLGRLSGIASLTRRYVDAVAGTRAKIYDTRKTTPGWRRLEKYAVRCGGGCNHRAGLFEAVLIKDNHLAFGVQSGMAAPARYTPAEAVLRVRRFLRENAGQQQGGEMIVEVEVDTLAQLDEVLPAEPDIILLDNMSWAELAQAVARRDARAPEVQLEASGGITLQTVRRIAESGVDRISVGALTHSAACLDIGLDWLSR
jgi:nicotinate-nucleotide pyrophosphorylase (carboxylating)